MKNRVIVQASFNVNDEDEKGLYDFVNAKKNVSKYIKRLIWLDKQGIRESTVALHEVEVVEEEEDMTGFI